MQERYSATLTECRDITGEIVLRTQHEGREPTPDEVAIFRSKIVDFMFLPGARAAFTAEAIAADTGLEHHDGRSGAASLHHQLRRNRREQRRRDELPTR